MLGINAGDGMTFGKTVDIYYPSIMKKPAIALAMTGIVLEPSHRFSCIYMALASWELKSAPNLMSNSSHKKTVIV
jgi:hypothetical protein